MMYFSADLEAYSFKYYLKHNRVKEYIIGAKSRDGELIIDTTIDGWLDQLDNIQADKKIFFHNGGNYDFQFLLPIIMKKYNPNDVGIMMDKKRSIYKITISKRYRDYNDINANGQPKRKQIKTTFLDSYKIWPMSLEKMGKTVGFKKLDYGDYDILDEFETVEDFKKWKGGKAYKYFIRDLDIPLKFMEATEKIKPIQNYKMTIASTAMSDWRKTRTTQSKISFWMKEQLEDGVIINNDYVWTTVKSAFKGGYTYVNPKYQLKKIKNVHINDIRSLYPWIMLNEKLPYGQAKDMDLPDYTLKYYKVKIKYAKAKIFPFIALPTNNQADVVRILKLLDKGIVEPKEETYPMELVDVDIIMNNYTYEFFNKHYEGEWTRKFLFNFQEANGQFHTYLTKWRTIKESSTGAIRQLSKDMSVSLGGKFGQDINNTISKVMNINDVELEKLPNGLPAVNGEPVAINGDLVYVRENNGMKRDYSYIPMSEAITAKARIKILTDIFKNKEKFVYCDTDSIHTIGKPTGLTFDENEYGCYASEGVWKESVYRNRKHYYNYNSDDDYQLKGAGLQVKNFNPKNLTLDQYLQPEFIVENGTLKRKIVDGGVLLYNVPYHFTMGKNWTK